MENVAVSYDKIKLDRGVIYRRTPDGSFYFRFQVDRKRKTVCLHTKNQATAKSKAQEMVPIAKASTIDVVEAHVKQAKGWNTQKESLELDLVWDVYDSHPNKANPATVNIHLRYQSYLRDFVTWAKALGLIWFETVDDVVAMKYASHLKTTGIGVDTHNKRIERVGRIFRTLKDYAGPNTTDWRNPNLKRKAREEIGITARRLPFSPEQEKRIFKVLDDPQYVCKNKEEIMVLFYIGAYTGQRQKDCCLLQWHKVDLERRRIIVVQFKTGKEVIIPIADQLLEVLKQAAGWKEEGNSYVLPKLSKRYLKKNKKRKDTGGGLVTVDVMRVLKWAGIESKQKVEGRDRAVTVYGFHSLRHSFVTFCSDNNVSKAVVVSILGAESKIIEQHYTHVNDEAKEQAIQLISGKGTSMKQRYEKALEYIHGLKKKSKQAQEIESILKGKPFENEM